MYWCNLYWYPPAIKFITLFYFWNYLNMPQFTNLSRQQDSVTFTDYLSHFYTIPWEPWIYIFQNLGKPPLMLSSSLYQVLLLLIFFLSQAWMHWLLKPPGTDLAFLVDLTWATFSTCATYRDCDHGAVHK